MSVCVICGNPNVFESGLCEECWQDTTGINLEEISEKDE